MRLGRLLAMVVTLVIVAVTVTPLALALVAWIGTPGPLASAADIGFWRATSMSVVVATAQCLGAVVIAASGGWVLARGRSRWATVLRYAVVLMAALPPAALLLGGFKLVAWAGLMNTLWAVVVPGWVAAGSILAAAAAYRSVDSSVIDAAALDGCSGLQAWWYIAVPGIRNTLHALVAWNLMVPWHQLLWPGVVWWDGRHQTLALWLAEKSGGVSAAGASAAGGQQIALACCTALPLLVLYGLVRSR